MCTHSIALLFPLVSGVLPDAFKANDCDIKRSTASVLFSDFWHFKFDLSNNFIALLFKTKLTINSSFEDQVDNYQEVP